MLAHAVEEAARLLNADGAMVYLVEGGKMRFAVDAGIRNPEARQLIRDLSLDVGVGLFGHAVATRELVVTGDYRRDRRFAHSPVADRIVLVANMRSMAAVPLVAGDEVLGALGAYSSRIDDFGEDELALLRALADHAATAIANQRLIERLARSQEELAQRVEAQRTLGEIAARIAIIRAPDEVLRSVVEAARRLIGSDGAHLTEMAPGGEALRPTVVVGGNAAWNQDWLRELAFPVGGGINGLAAGRNQVIATEDYLVDPRIPHEPSDQDIAERLELRGMAAAPLRGPHGEVIGTLAVSFERPHWFGTDQLELLQGLADQGAIAISNARLAEELQLSRERYRFLVDESVDIMWSIDADARFTFISDSVERMTGFRPDELIGRHVSVATAPESMPVVEATFRELREHPERVYRIRILEPRRDGTNLPVEIRATGIVDGDGRMIGAHGTNRDITEISRLEADLRAQAEELAHRVEAQRTLAEMAAQLTSVRDPSAVLVQTLTAAVRLLRADGGQIGMVDTDADGVVRWGDGHSLARGTLTPFTAEDHTRIDDGVSGRALRERRPSWTDDYLADTTFPHDPATDRVCRELGIRSVISAPLIGEEGAIGAIGVFSDAPSAFDADDAELLGLLAGQATIVLTNARLYEELERRVEAQRSLREIAARITAIRDPGDVLQRTLDEAVRLLDADGGRIELVAEGGALLWAFGHSAIDLPIERALGERPVTAEEGVSGRAVAERRVVRTGDYLADQSFIHAEAPDRYIRQHGIRSVMSAPLIGEEGAIGSITVHSQVRGAFDEPDAELLEVLASQAAIAVTNARLYEQLRERVDAQRSLAEISAAIASLHEPQTVLDRAVADAARLLNADRAQINLTGEKGAQLERPIAAAPIPPSPDDVVVPIGSGIAGMAAAERRVRWTGDYLADQAFPHDEGDTRIEAQAIHSMMSAPLLGPDRLIGTITVQSMERHAFSAEDAELLQLLADQAAIALTNARLYAEVEESERRYRHLVDNSPDIVWSVDADGRFTFFSDSLESRTGWKPEQLLRHPFTILASEETLAQATGAWETLRAEPNREQRVRLDLPLPDGRIAQTEVAMTGTVVDGRFAGAHGSVRDISERERLEGDLRSQAAELAASQERAHLARELHDSVTQALFSMGLTLRTLELLLGTDTDAARDKVAELRELQKDALAEMRTLIFELRPASLESDGLIQALRTHATAVGRRTGLAVVVDAEPIDRLPLPVEEALYRIGQEALHNVVKHANADTATLRIWREGDRISLTVTDDGAGFDPADVPRGHLGLIGMRQRVDLVGGELRVESDAGQGTTIAASVPIEPEPAAE
jgi:PAS domain S-box-containing protein